MSSQPKRVFVAGHAGMVGSAVVRSLTDGPGFAVLTAPRAEVDCKNQAQVHDYLNREKPYAVVVAAAKVGGIHANNTYPAEFAYDNLMIEANLIHGAHLAGVQQLVFLGSSCIYPKFADQPMQETALLTGVLEPTNEPYAVAKIAGIKLCESYNRQYGRDYRSLMPTNLYGPGDNYHPENSHVIPALIQRFHNAKIADDPTVTVWGTGKAMREFLHVDDLAASVRFALEARHETWSQHVAPQCSHVNVGTGTDVTIGELAALVGEVVGYTGELAFDTTKPDGTPRKLLDTSLINGLGWHPQITLRDGLADAYRWFLDHQDGLRR